jgi:uncharacterized metal-binding protein YceD (DUF177 family)
MKIAFSRVGQSEKSIKLTLKGVTLEGTLVKRGYHQVKLDGKLEGTIKLICDRCGGEFPENVDAPLNLTLSEAIVHTQDDLDIIEFLDGVIDLDFILESEIGSMENSYHRCPKCAMDKGEFEQEF